VVKAGIIKEISTFFKNLLLFLEEIEKQNQEVIAKMTPEQRFYYYQLLQFQQ